MIEGRDLVKQPPDSVTAARVMVTRPPDSMTESRSW
jgi:hypothetical protein